MAARAGGIRPATPRAMFSVSSNAWSRGLNFGHVRKRLREFAGLSPSFPIRQRAGRRSLRSGPVAERWADRQAVWPNSPTWRYLARKRRLPSAIIQAAAARTSYERARQAAPGSRISMTRVPSRMSTYADRPTRARSPAARNLSSVCRQRGSALPRLVVAEASIDALSVAAIENVRADTLYAATGGGMGPGTIAAFEALLAPSPHYRAQAFAARPTPTGGRSVRRPSPIHRRKIQCPVHAASPTPRRRRLE